MPAREVLSLNQMGAKLAAVFDENDLEAAKNALRDALKATRRMRIRDAKGQIQYEDVPDYPIRTMAGVKIVEWAVGKPISRSVHAEIPAQGAATGEKEFFEEALRDPEAAKSLQETLGKMIAAAQKAVPVDVEARQALPEGSAQPPESQSEGSPR